LRLSFNFWLDPKIVTSFIVLALYGYFLVIWHRGVRGERLAWMNVLSFLMVCTNVVVSMFWSSFHRW
jgi:HemX protein